MEVDQNNVQESATNYVEDIVKTAPCNSKGAVPKKLSMCEVCSITEAKYTCPRCEVRTCCLKCSNIHKKELECSGMRNKAKYIPLNKFTNLDLSSDYRLLEEIQRNLDGYKKATRHDQSHLVPHHLFKLRKACYERKTILKFLPQKFGRHKKNSTRLNYATKIIFWHIEWVFVSAEGLRLSDEKIAETETLASVFSKYLLKQEDIVLQEKLQHYQSTSTSRIKLLLKAEQKRGKRFYELDLDLSIRENLQKKIIIEYPIIYVVLQDQAIEMDIIDSDDEDGIIDPKLGSDIVENIIKKAASDDSLYSSLRNLLFISDIEADLSE